MFKVSQLERFLGFSHVKIKRFKQGYRYRKVLRMYKLDTSSIFHILQSIGLKPKAGKNTILFVFKSKNQYFNSFHIIKSISNQYPNFSKRIIVIRDLEKDKNKQLRKLLLDIITFKYNRVYIKDFSNNSLFINTLKELIYISTSKQPKVLE